MDSLKDIISDIRIFLYGGILTLPLTIAGTLTILGLFTANYAILFFLLGFLVLTPILSSLLNLGISEGTIALLKAIGQEGINPFRTKSADVCKVVIPFLTLNTNTMKEDTTNVAISSWLAMITFFIGYIFTNALQLYSRESPDTDITVTSTTAPDISSKIVNRKSQAIISMVSIIVFLLIVLGFRLYSGCEGKISIALTTLIFFYLGNSWYYALSGIGEDRLSDLFGIANRLLPPSAISNAPIACVPIHS
jgi:hypothetical protein